MEAKEFGEYLKRLRKNRKLTLKQLSQDTELTVGYLSNIENGRRGIPSPEILNKLAGPLGESPLNLMIKAGHINMDEAIQNSFNKLTLDLKKTLRKAEKWLTIDGVQLEPNVKLSIEHFLEKKNIKSITTENLFEELEKFIHGGVWNEPFNDEEISLAELFDKLDLLVSKRELATLDIGDILKNSASVTYNGHKLTDQDREQALDMLEVLFKKYR